jgi:hypothetical protein
MSAQAILFSSKATCFDYKLVIFNTPEQLPKSPQCSQHGEQKQYRTKCQHPGEGTHIHAVEQVQPQGMKKQRTKERNTTGPTVEYPMNISTLLRKNF